MVIENHWHLKLTPWCSREKGRGEVFSLLPGLLQESGCSPWPPAPRSAAGCDGSDHRSEQCETITSTISTSSHHPSLLDLTCLLSSCKPKRAFLQTSWRAIIILGKAGWDTAMPSPDKCQEYKSDSLYVYLAVCPICHPIGERVLHLGLWKENPSHCVSAELLQAAPVYLSIPSPGDFTSHEGGIIQ